MLWYYNWLLLVSSVLSSPAWVEHYLTTGIHRKLTNQSAVYFTFAHSRSLREAKGNLLWAINPCGDQESEAFGNRTVVCGDSYVEDFVGNSTLVDQMCKIAKQREPSDELAMTFPKIIRLFRKGETHPAFDVLWMAEDRCQCTRKCSNGTVVVDKWPTCSCRRGALGKSSYSACDFQKKCDWTYKDLGFQVSNRYKNFVYVYTVADNSSVSTMYSPYYTQFTSSCTLSFLYNLAGTNQAEIRIFLEWRKYPGQSSSAQDVLLSRLKVHQEDSGVLDYHEIRVGFVTKHARIRIDCLTADGEGKAVCKIANITWNNCAERDITDSPCLGQQNPTLCLSQGRTVCLEDVACDGIRDCPNGEDEANCDYIEKPGSKCTFTNSTGMCGWAETAYPPRRIGRNLFIRGRLTSSLAVEDSDGRVLETKVMRETPRNDTEYFLLVSGRRNRSSFDTREYSLESPLFPPTKQFTGDLFRPDTICTARFRYCIKGSEQRFLLELERNAYLKDNRKNIIQIWEPDQSTVADFEAGTKCEWHTASVKIPRQLQPFKLRFTMKLLPRYRIPFVAIDDFSINPSCFDYNSHPNVVVNQTYGSCGKTGTEIPGYDECRRESFSNGGSEVEVYNNGSRMLTIIRDGFYWVKICGGAGGSFPEAPGVGGSCITGTVHLDEGSRMRFILGHKGTSPCNGPTDTLSLHQEKVFKYICGLDNSSISDVIEPELYIGAGGGGLSALFLVDDSPGMVAGGGGGAFPAVFQPNWFTIPINGNGFSLKHNHTSEECNKECEEATPQEIDKQGECYKRVPFETQGGYGGGGTSCGTGGGGGGGYFGGKYGRYYVGQSGSDYVSEAIAKGSVGYFHGMNPGDGTLTLIYCSLECKPPSYCDFLSLESSEMVCGCGPGKIVVNETCMLRTVVESATTAALTEVPSHWIIAVLVGLFFIALTVTLVARYNYTCFKVISRKHFGKNPGQKADEGTELLDITQGDLLDRLFVNQPFIKNIPNKNLVMFLNRLDDNDLKIHEIIGQGAFGNVSRGVLREADGSYKEVAVKVLNTEWSSETESATRNFVTEAILMSLSNNVGKGATIQLIGVVLDRRPYKIVMELMKGGNLLNFLRSSRPNDECENPNNLSIGDLIQFAKDIVDGCLVLEKNQHLHRDLAARNCLLTKLGSGRRVKIGDFGLATELYNSGEYVSRVRHRPIPMKWMPPEAIQDGVFSTKTDVWSFGVVCWEVFTIGQIPYSTVPNDYLVDILAQGKRLAKPKGCPQEIYDEVMLECWQPYPEQRPSFALLRDRLSAMLADTRLMTQPIPLVYGSEKVSSPVLEDPIFDPIAGTPMTIETTLPTPINADERSIDQWIVTDKSEKSDQSEKSSLESCSRKASVASANKYVVDTPAPLHQAFRIQNPSYSKGGPPERPTELPLTCFRYRDI